MTESSQYKVAAVDRALLVLETLAESPRQGATEIATRLGLTKSLVFRLLATLEARGVVARDAEQPLYSLGHRIGVLGDRAGAQNVLLAAARPVMERLRDETSENVNLLVREGPQSLVVATLAGRHAIRIFAVAGRHGPLHAGGGSLLILAFAPEAVRERVLSSPLTRFTDATLTAPEELRARIKTIRTEGYNVSINALDEGAFSVAAPIAMRWRGGRGAFGGWRHGPLRRGEARAPPCHRRNGGRGDQRQTRRRHPAMTALPTLSRQVTIWSMKLCFTH